MMGTISSSGVIDAETDYSLMTSEASYRLVFGKDCKFVGFDRDKVSLDSESTYRAWGDITETGQQMEVSGRGSGTQVFKVRVLTVKRFERLKPAK